MHKHTLKIHTMEKLVEDEKSVIKHFRTKDFKTTSTLVSSLLISSYVSTFHTNPHQRSLYWKNKTSITYIIQDSEYYKP